MLNDELESTSLLPDYGVLAIFVPLDSANKLSNLAESTFETLLENFSSLAFKQSANSVLVSEYGLSLTSSRRLLA